jgi:hypothetical protein
MSFSLLLLALLYFRTEHTWQAGSTELELFFRKHHPVLRASPEIPEVK